MLKFIHRLCDAINWVTLNGITVEQQAEIENSCNLIFVRSEQSLIEGGDHNEIDCMIQYNNKAYFGVLMMINQLIDFMLPGEKQ